MGKHEKRAAENLADVEKRIAFLAGEQARLGSEHEETASRAAEQLVANGDYESGSVAQSLERLGILDRALSTLAAKKVDLARAVLHGRAEDLRDDANAKDRELESLQAKTAKLLSELSRLERVKYDESILARQAEGPFPFQTLAKPLSQQLQYEITSLRAGAVALDEQADSEPQPAPPPPIVVHGHADGSLLFAKDVSAANPGRIVNVIPAHRQNVIRDGSGR